MTIQDNAKILYVEDDEAIRELTSEILRSNGYDVVAASSSEEALRAFDAHDRFDLLVTDLRLPGIDGRELVKRARQTQADLRVVMVTGYPGEAAREDASVDERSTLLGKPFTLRQLLGCVRSALSQRLAT